MKKETNAQPCGPWLGRCRCFCCRISQQDRTVLLDKNCWGRPHHFLRAQPQQPPHTRGRCSASSGTPGRGRPRRHAGHMKPGAMYGAGCQHCTGLGQEPGVAPRKKKAPGRQEFKSRPFIGVALGHPASGNQWLTSDVVPLS